MHTTDNLPHDSSSGEALPDSTFVAVAPRGPLSNFLCELLTGSKSQLSASQAGELHQLVEEAVASETDLARNDDVQLALFILYSLHYRSLPQYDPRWEWNLDLLGARRVLETAFESELRSAIVISNPPGATRHEVAQWLFDATAPQPGPSLARQIAREATSDQVLEFLKRRSIYTLREADPHAWAVPRLTGRAKAALVEIESDEYGGGNVERMHSGLFAQTMRGAGLSDRYGAYLNEVPALTLASQNMMSMFGLNGALTGAIVGHLAAFEMTSSLPNRLYGDGFRRLGYGPEVTHYFDEHVEADAVHEQIAAHDLAGALVEDRPELLTDVLFGALACITVDDWETQDVLSAWKAGRSSLREDLHGESSDHAPEDATELSQI